MPAPPPPIGPGPNGEADPPDGEDELELVVTPRPAELEALGISEEEFEAALEVALDRLEDAPEDDGEPPAAVEEIEITLNGRLFRLGEVADVEITGDLSELGELPPAEPPPENDDRP